MPTLSWFKILAIQEVDFFIAYLKKHPAFCGMLFYLVEPRHEIQIVDIFFIR